MNRPVWIVGLHMDARKGKPAEQDIKYVRAATQAGAVRCAKYNSMLPLRARAWARVATPKELGCVPVAGAAIDVGADRG